MMNIVELEAFLCIAGRYQVYSDGEGGYFALPVPQSIIEITQDSHNQLDAQRDDLLYNNHKG